MRQPAQVPYRGLPGWTGSLRSHPLGTHQHPFAIRQGFIEGLLYVDLLGANKAASLEMVLAPSCTVLCPRVRGCCNPGGEPCVAKSGH